MVKNDFFKRSIVALSLGLGLMGVAFAEEVVEAIETPAVEVSGEFSTDFTFGDNLSMTTPYAGLALKGDGWLLSTKMTQDESGSMTFDAEEVWYNWNVTDGIAVTFGRQAEPYGIAWGLHKPSKNWFVSSPRDHMTRDGIGLAVKTGFGLGVNVLYGNVDEEGGDNYWGLRTSYGLSIGELATSFGVSLNNNDAMLVDVTTSGKAVKVAYEVALEYDMSDLENDDDEGSYWLRSMITPEIAMGAYFTLGYNSDEVMIYGVGYKCTDKMRISTEFTSGLKDAEGNDVESDFSIRASYSF